MIDPKSLKEADSEERRKAWGLLLRTVAGVDPEAQGPSPLDILQARVASLEYFICHGSGIVNEWAASCPCGTKLTDHIKGELDRWLKLNRR